MKKFLLLGLMVLLVGKVYSSPNKICTFEDVLKPEMMNVSNNHVYIMEGSTIFDYSLTKAKLLRKFGKGGEGPGELKPSTQYSNSISFYHDYLFVDSVDKIIYFSKKGSLIKEKRKHPGYFRLMPIGKNFAGLKLVTSEGSRYFTLNLFNSKLEIKKELHRQLCADQGRTLKLIPESINFWVSDDKLFLEKSTEGFLIDVLDSNGEKLYRIEKKCKRIKVTDEHKKGIIEELKADPRVIDQGWDNIKNIFKFTYAASFPPIQDIVVEGKKIYVKTFKTKNEKVEFIIMDLTGKIEKKVYLPEAKERYLVKVGGFGPKFYCIRDNKYYYMKENEETEAWELYVIDMATL